MREKHKHPGPGIVIGTIEIEGPLEAWPATSRLKTLGGVDPAKGTLKDIRAILSKILPDAFRRKTSPADVEPYVALSKAVLDQKRPFMEALRVGLKGILCSPDFLFLDEPLTDGAPRINDFALATSLFR